MNVETNRAFLEKEREDAREFTEIVLHTEQLEVR